MTQLSPAELDLILRDAKRLRAQEIRRLTAAAIEGIARFFRRSAQSRNA